MLEKHKTLPETNSKFAPENRPSYKETSSSSNHPFSGAKMLVSGREIFLVISFLVPRPARAGFPQFTRVTEVKTNLIYNYREMTKNTGTHSIHVVYLSRFTVIFMGSM